MNNNQPLDFKPGDRILEGFKIQEVDGVADFTKVVVYSFGINVGLTTESRINLQSLDGVQGNVIPGIFIGHDTFVIILELLITI